ncbi:energy transducer TonB [Undibacterium sp. RTI2.1]|uniref:energy transducer TonB n=1 Tax=unclassified Undibacterium TaxID=2630295 RepID=UPI002AB48C6D|nr:MULTISPECIES: energy transducer TonB [unclassified Undibacterium]MDY7539439.1 energy transducer TonB [Undibacterium sp. 5I1]MEB0029643.1 energy transducer TonB [Undibacterium sp. RTI2.1]MEB0116114.1 energy transducer TonB [Undibacterium sp. RTI2.2]MEB0231386.1 energy transducer TonB [Undibacterium sp. 10I3]MEB0258386.1 energy transducer TonB [Undibacterium sp. 5I1]
MSATTRHCYAIAALLLAVASAPTFAAEIKSPFDTKNCEMPAYPDKSLSQSEEGMVKLQFVTDAAGKVVDAKVVQSSGHRSLDNASLNAVKECNFKPVATAQLVAKNWSNISFVWVME